MPVPVTRVNITPGTTGSFQTVDLTSYLGSNAGSVAGVTLEVLSNAASSDHAFGAQHPDSTDNHTANIYRGSHQHISCGINSSDEVEIYVAHADIVVYLVMVWLNSEATFNANATEMTSLTADWSWNDYDASSYSGAETGKLFFGYVTNSDTSGRIFGLSYNEAAGRGSANIEKTSKMGFMVPADGSEIFDYLMPTGQDAYISFYLLGYATDNVTALTSQIDYTAAGTGAYEDVDFSTDIPAGNEIAICQYRYASGPSGSSGNIRNKSDAVDVYKLVRDHDWAIVQLNSSRVAEQKVSNIASLSLDLIAYASDPSASGAVVPVIVNTINALNNG